MTDQVNNLATAQPNNPRFATGTKVRTAESTIAIAAATSAVGDKLVLAGPFSYADRISAIRVNSAGTPALISATDNDLGFYYKDSEGTLVAIDADILWDGADLSAALTHPNLLAALAVGTWSADKNIGQLLGKGNDEQPAGGVYLVLTMNTASTAAGPLDLALAIDIDEASTS